MGTQRWRVKATSSISRIHFNEYKGAISYNVGKAQEAAFDRFCCCILDLNHPEYGHSSSLTIESAAAWTQLHYCQHRL